MPSTPGLLTKFSLLIARLERRRAERTRVTGLWCTGGQVIDVSLTGLRMTSRSRWGEGDARNITLGDDRTSVELRARCVWCRQEGTFSHNLGLAFVNPTAEQQAAIARIAEAHRAPNQGHSVDKPL